MCTIFIFIKADNIHPDPSQDWRKFKAGDVIDVIDSDTGYGGEGVTGPNASGIFATIILPGVQASEVVSLCMGDEDDGTDQPRRLRINKIDVDGIRNTLTIAMKTALRNNQPVTITKAQLLSFRSTKPAIAALVLS